MVADGTLTHTPAGPAEQGPPMVRVEEAWDLAKQATHVSTGTHDIDSLVNEHHENTRSQRVNMSCLPYNMGIERNRLQTKRPPEPPSLPPAQDPW